MKKVSVFLPVLLLVGLGLLTYSFSFRNGFIGDDGSQIVINPLIESVKNIPRLFGGGTFYFEAADTLKGGYYRPLPMTAYTLITVAFGKNPTYFHLFQTLVHIGNAIMVFFLMQRFLNQKTALLSAAIFMVHPINVETVVHAANLQDVLFVGFGLLAILFLKHRPGYSAIALLLSLFAKETGILFLFAAYLYTRIFIPKQQALQAKYGFLILLIYLTFRVGAVGFAHAQTTAYPIAKASLPVRLLTLPAVNLYYLKTFVYPNRLFSMQQWLVTTVTDANFYLSLVAVLTVCFGLYLLTGRLKKHDPDSYAACLLFSGWLAAGMLMHSQLLPLDATVSDRWFYFPIIGLIGILGIIIQKLPRFIILIAFALVPLLMARSIVRSADWQNEFTLYNKDAVPANPSFVLLNGLGVVYYKQGDFLAAEKHLLESIHLTPDWLFSWMNLGRVYEAKYYQTGDQTYLTKALTSYQKTLPLTGSTEGYELISNLYLKTGQLTEARIVLENGLNKHPNNGKLLFNLSLVEYRSNNFRSALQLAKQAAAILPYEKTESWYRHLVSTLSP